MPACFLLQIVVELLTTMNLVYYLLYNFNFIISNKQGSLENWIISLYLNHSLMPFISQEARPLALTWKILQANIQKKKNGKIFSLLLIPLLHCPLFVLRYISDSILCVPPFFCYYLAINANFRHQSLLIAPNTYHTVMYSIRSKSYGQFLIHNDI